MVSMRRANSNRLLRFGITLLIIIVALLSGFWRLSDISAEGPILDVSAPAQVEVGQPIELTLVVRNASGIGGYQSRLLFDTSRAHLSGVDHSANELAAIGRFVQTLGPNEYDGGVSFGLYSCPVDECGATGKPVDRGADGELNLVTVRVTPDQPGPFSLELSDLRFSDASGTEVSVETSTLVVVVDVVVGQE